MLDYIVGIQSIVYNFHQNCNILVSRLDKLDLKPLLYIKCNSTNQYWYNYYLMECKKVSILSMCRHLYNKHSSIDIQNNFHSKQKSQLNSLNIYYECHKNYSFLGKSYCIENFLNRVYILLNNISNEFYLHISNSAKHKYHSSILHPEHICQSSTLSKLIHFNYMKDKMGWYDCTKHILNLTCRLSAESYYM